jgi:hypothetical protein
MQPQWHKNQFFRILLTLRFSKDLVELGVQREMLYVEYQVYSVPGLIGMVLLFNSMQSSLSMVYD